MIVRVNVVLNKTVVVDSYWCLEKLYDSHLQSQSELTLALLTQRQQQRP